MMIAKTREGQRIKAQKNLSSRQLFLCPACSQPVILKKGQKRLPHFAHKKVNCQAFSENESLEHLRGKTLLYSWLKEESRLLEPFLPKLQQRPDIMCQQFVLEFQCARIGFTQFEARTKNYLQNGYNPWWILGQSFFPKQRWTLLQKACCTYSKKTGPMLWILNGQEERLICLHSVYWHYCSGYFNKKQFFSRRDFSLEELYVFQPNCAKRCLWAAHSYQSWAQRQLYQKQVKLLEVQGMLYTLGGNLLTLPLWCYQASMYHFFFEHRLCVLRFLYLLFPKNYLHFYQKVAALKWEWGFPLVAKNQILEEIFSECQRLSRNSNQKIFLEFEE